MRGRLVKIVLALFFVINLIFLTIFSNRDGYEGDDLNSILPMLHLQDAKRGDLLIYRYNWQPLSYEVGSAIFQITKKPSAIFLLAPIAGATSLLLLLLNVWRERESAFEFEKSFIALLAIPELWFSGLYFNSTILGLPFAIGARMCLQSRSGLFSSFLAGIILVVAILMRFDFILVAPALAWIAWQQNGFVTRAAVFAFGVLAGLGLAYSVGLIDPLRIFEIYVSSTQEIAAKTNVPGWDMRTKLGVLSVVLSPVGWILLMIGGPIVMLKSFRQNKSSLIAWTLVLAPLCLPLPNLLSVKYAIPLIMFVPSFLVLCLSSIEEQMRARIKRWAVDFVLICTILSMLVSLSLTGTTPFVHFGTLASRPIGTHDGLRSYGGYLWQMVTVNNHSAVRTERQLLADQIREEFLQISGPDLLFAGSENFFDFGGVGWRELQLKLEDAEIHGTVASPHQVQFDYGSRRLTLTRDLPQDFKIRFDRGSGLKLYDFREKE